MGTGERVVKTCMPRNGQKFKEDLYIPHMFKNVNTKNAGAGERVAFSTKNKYLEKPEIIKKGEADGSPLPLSPILRRLYREEAIPLCTLGEWYKPFIYYRHMTYMVFLYTITRL